MMAVDIPVVAAEDVVEQSTMRQTPLCLAMAKIDLVTTAVLPTGSCVGIMATPNAVTRRLLSVVPAQEVVGNSAHS